MITKEINIKVNGQQAEAELKNVNKELKQTDSSLNEISGVADKATGGMVSKFRGLTSTIGGVVKGFNSMKIAIIGTGIGALLIAVVSLIQAFKRSEEGQNKFAKIMGVIGSVVNNVLDLFADLGETIISAFENPKQAFENFKKAIKENIENRINAALDLFGYLGSAIKKVFSGDFTGAVEDAKKAGSSYIDVMTGVEDTIGKTTEKIKEFAEEVKKDGENAAKIADARAKADKKARELLVQRADAERKIADLREKAADKENYIAQERIDFLKEAGKLNEEIADKETEVAKLRFDAKKLENSLSKSTKEDLDEAAQLEAELIGKQTEKLRLQKAITAEITTATREMKAGNKEQVDDTKSTLDEINKIREEYRKKNQDFEDETELQKIEREKERKLAELDALKASEEQKREVLDYYNTLERKAKDKNTSDEIAREELLKKQKIDFAKNTFGAIADILGENTKAGKAAAIAQALINTYQGVSNVWAEKAESDLVGAGLAQRLITTAIVAAQGFATVRKIASVKTPKGGGGSSIGSAGASFGGATQPQFNVVGNGAATGNQIEGTLGNQQPIQAYVVANQVTTQQALDRNIVNNASLG